MSPVNCGDGKQSFRLVAILGAASTCIVVRRKDIKCRAIQEAEKVVVVGVVDMHLGRKRYVGCD